MILDKDQLNKLNEINQFIIDKYDYFLKNQNDLLYSEKEIIEIVKEKKDIESVNFCFPGDNDCIGFEVEEFLELGNDIKSIKILNNGHIKTETRSYIIIEVPHFDETFTDSDFEVIIGDDISIRIIDESLIIGLAAVELKEYDEDYWGTAQQYRAIEIIYKDKSKVLNEDKEIDLIDSYLFELTDSTNFSISYSEIRNPIPFFDSKMDVVENSQKLRPLIPCNDGMQLFISAIQINDPELKFLNFYKILEFFSPIAVNVEAYELMRKKLDTQVNSLKDGSYIKSIFDLAISTDNKFNDLNLIQTSLNKCIDIIGLFDKLPPTIQKKIARQFKGKEINYSLKSQEITTINNMIGKIIYKTRNMVVHAKSNFESTGEEILLNDFPQLNVFMKEASSQAIRWYSRLPEHIKLEEI